MTFCMSFEFDDMGYVLFQTCMLCNFLFNGLNFRKAIVLPEEHGDDVWEWSYQSAVEPVNLSIYILHQLFHLTNNNSFSTWQKVDNFTSFATQEAIGVAWQTIDLSRTFLLWPEERIWRQTENYLSPIPLLGNDDIKLVLCCSHSVKATMSDWANWALCYPNIGEWCRKIVQPIQHWTADSLLHVAEFLPSCQQISGMQCILQLALSGPLDLDSGFDSWICF